MNDLTKPKQTDVSFAGPHDLKQIKHLWHICFHDDMEYIDEFFSRVDFDTSNNNILIKTVNDEVASMMFLLASSIKIDNATFSCIYLFAVATLPKYQGRGYMRELEQFACDYAISQDILHLTLVPQGEDLFNLYSKLGFSTNFYLDNTLISLDEISLDCLTSTSVSISELDNLSFFNMRTNYLNTLSYYCKLDDSINDFLYYDFINSDISLLLVTVGVNTYYACVKVCTDCLNILESSIPAFTYSALALHFGCTKIKLVSPVNTPDFFNLDVLTTSQTPYGMYKYLGDDPSFYNVSSKGYMNFMLL